VDTRETTLRIISNLYDTVFKLIAARPSGVNCKSVYVIANTYHVTNKAEPKGGYILISSIAMDNAK